MQFLIPVALFALPFAVAAADGASTSSTTICYTNRGPKSKPNVRPSTSSESYTSTETVVVTSTPTTTVTPTAITLTNTETAVTTVTTTLSQLTDTVVDMTTTHITNTITADTPSTTVTETDTTTSTTTAAVASGFTPVQSSLPGSEYVGTLSRVKRHAAARSPKQPKQPTSPKQKGPLAGGNTPMSYQQQFKFPVSITCYKIVHVTLTTTTTQTATMTSTIMAPQDTSTQTITTTMTIVSTEVPGDASTTVTDTNTITDTATTTPATSTATQTETVAATTTLPASVAQCAPENFANGIGTYAIKIIFDEAYAPVSYTKDSAAVSCCVSCANNPQCSYFAFNGGNAAGQQCGNFISTDICSNGHDSESVYEDTLANGAGTEWTVGNGNCGSWVHEYLYVPDDDY